MSGAKAKFYLFLFYSVFEGDKIKLRYKHIEELNVATVFLEKEGDERWLRFSFPNTYLII